MLRDSKGRFVSGVNIVKRDAKGRFLGKRNIAVDGYKGFDAGYKCRKKQYKLGETFVESEASLCSSGMHFCTWPLDVWGYRYLTDGVAEAKRTGKILSIEKYLNTGVITCVKMLEAQSLRYTVTYTNECNTSREVIMSAEELYATAAAAKKAFYSGLLRELTEIENELAALLEK